MDWQKLQHTLYNMDPTDPKEDLAKLKQQAAGGNGQPTETKNYVTESVDVQDGSLPVGVDSIADFAALAGVKLTESQKAGDYAKGKDPMPKAKPGRTDHPLKDKLVGDSMDQDVDEGPVRDLAQKAKAGFAAGRASPGGVDAMKQAYKGKAPEKDKEPADKKQKQTKSAPSMRLATALGTSNTTLMNQAIQRLQQGQALSRNHYAPIEEAFTNMLNMDRRQLQRVMAIMAQGKTSESVEEAKPSKTPQERNPHSQDLQALRRSGAMGSHKDKKKQLPRKQKHKSKMANESIKDELYRRLNAKK
jgi:hypothetical protein